MVRSIYIFVKWVFMSKTFTQLFIKHNRYWHSKNIDEHINILAIDGIENEVIKEMLFV